MEPVMTRPGILRMSLSDALLRSLADCGDTACHSIFNWNGVELAVLP